jgi:hypothetical protein
MDNDVRLYIEQELLGGPLVAEIKLIRLNRLSDGLSRGIGVMCYHNIPHSHRLAHKLCAKIARTTGNEESFHTVAQEIVSR